jgi:hypothetical protein
MKLPVLEPENLPDYSEQREVIDDQLTPQASHPNGKNGEDEPEEDDDYDETYGDLEDGHNDLNDQESDRGVDNLE